MPDAPEASPVERRIHTAQLASFVARLHQSLIKSGIAPEKGAALMGSSLSSKCVSCAIEMRGEELLQLAGPADPAAPSNAKLDRSRQGYCARAGCDSYFVNLVAAPAPEVDWAKAFAQADNEMPQEDALPREAASHATPPLQRKRVRIAIGLALVLVAFVIRQLVTHRAIPFIYEPTRFKADPSSLPSESIPEPARR
jgi:hypothetical protein